MSLDPEALESAARTLIGRLKTAKQRLAGRPEADVRQALTVEVRAALAGLSPDDYERATAAARELVALEMATREQAPAAPAGPDPATRARLLELEARVQQLESDKHRLAQDNTRLLARLASLPDAPVAPQRGGDGSLDRVRQALVAVARQHDVSLDAYGLDREEQAFVVATAQLLRFAQDTKSAMALLMADFRLGAAAAMSSVMISNTSREVPDRYAAALRGDAEAARALGSTLESCRAELADLNEAFTQCIPRGARLLLKELDPNPIAAERKGAFGGTDERQAWNDYVRLHGDLKELGPGEMWERFFHPALKQHLAGGARLANPGAPADRVERPRRRPRE